MFNNHELKQGILRSHLCGHRLVLQAQKLPTRGST